VAASINEFVQADAADGYILARPGRVPGQGGPATAGARRLPHRVHRPDPPRPPRPPPPLGLPVTPSYLVKALARNHHH
jgi:hypothetical protein